MRAGREPQDEPRIGDACIGETTVALVAGERCRAAQVLALGRAVATCSARRAEPGYAHAIADRER